MSIRIAPTFVFLAACARGPAVPASLVVIDGTVVKDGAAPTSVTPCVNRAPIERAVQAEPGYQWISRHFVGVAPAPSTTEALLAQLDAAYLTPDFVACHAASLSPELNVATLLGRGERSQAVRAALYGAACAWKMGPGFRTYARDALTTVLAKHDLDATSVLATSSLKDPSFLAFVAEVQAELDARPQRTTEVRITPDGARISINGQRVACETSRCRVKATDGDSVIVTAERFGYAPLITSVPAGENAQLSLTVLDSETERQVASAIHASDRAPYPKCPATALAAAPAATISGVAPSLDAIGEAAARDLGTRLVLFVDVRDRAASAMVYDRIASRVIARRAQTATGQRRGVDVAPGLARDALASWRARSTAHWYTSWKFWAGVAVVAAAASGTTVYLLKENDYDLVPQD